MKAIHAFSNFSFVHFFVILLFVITQTAVSQPTTWETVISNAVGYSGGNSVSKSIDKTNDSGLVLLGNNFIRSQTWPYSVISNQAILIKLDQYGSMNWSKGISLSHKESEANKAIQANDGGYLIIGGVDGNLIKTDAQGMVQWSKTYGKYAGTPLNRDGELCYFNDIQKTSDSAYVIAGATSNFGTRGSSWNGLIGMDIYLVKVDNLGNVLWANTYGNDVQKDFAFSVKQTNDGGFIVAGLTNPAQYDETAFLLRIASDGSKKWAQKYYLTNGPVISTVFNDVTPTGDGGYIATGLDAFNDGAWVVKTTSNGALEWSKIYTVDYNHNPSFGTGIYQTMDGNYLLQAGNGDASYADRDDNSQNLQLFKLDALGNILWKKGYGNAKEVLTNKSNLVLTQDGGAAFCSYVVDSVFAGLQSSTYFTHVVKVDSLGNNGTCQTTKLGLFAIPTIFVEPFPLVQLSGYMLTNLTAVSSSTYSIVVNTGICSNIPIEASFYAYTACLGDSTTFINTSNGGIFKWNFGDPSSGIHDSSSLPIPKHLYSSVGNYTLTLISIDGTGSPSDTAKGLVTILPTKFITAGINVTICNGDSTQLSASGSWNLGYFIGWTPSNNTTSDTLYRLFAHPTISTQYLVQANNGGCTDRDSLIITVIGSPTISISGNKTICKGQSTSLTTFGAAGYLWSTGETSQFVAINTSMNTTYTLTSYSGGCGFNQQVKITVLPSFTVNAGDDVTIVSGDEIVLLASGDASNYNWSPPQGLSCLLCPSPKAKPTNTTTYYVTSNATSLCPQTDSVIVYILNCDEGVVIPNVFSPNNDEYNDVLYVTGTSCFKSMLFTIYDRWGNKVFTAEKTNEGWDGTYKGKLMDAGIFVYSLEVITIMNDPIEKKGNVSLIK